MAKVADEAQKYVGGGILRKEEPEWLTGAGRYIDDMSIPGMLWVSFVRSPFAHATINSVDKSRAESMPGVRAVYSGADLADDWADGLPCAWPVTEDIKSPKHRTIAK